MQTANQIFGFCLMWGLVVPALIGIGINAGRILLRSRSPRGDGERGE